MFLLSHCCTIQNLILNICKSTFLSTQSWPTGCQPGQQIINISGDMTHHKIYGSLGWKPLLASYTICIGCKFVLDYYCWLNSLETFSYISLLYYMISYNNLSTKQSNQTPLEAYLEDEKFTKFTSKNYILNK